MFIYWLIQTYVRFVVNFETTYKVNIDSDISKVLIGSRNFLVDIRAGSPIVSSPIKSLRKTESIAALIDPDTVNFSGK